MRHFVAASDMTRRGVSSCRRLVLGQQRCCGGVAKSILFGAVAVSEDICWLNGAVHRVDDGPACQ